MRESLESRLKRLEALPRPEQPAQSEPMTADSCQRWCYNSFHRNKLRIVGGVVDVYDWTTREHERPALEIMANTINRWRADNGNEPFLPIMPDDDAKEALALLRTGYLRVVIGPYQIITEDYNKKWEDKVDNHRICIAIDRALGVYLASGGNDGQPYQPGEIEELLAAFVEHAEANQE